MKNWTLVGLIATCILGTLLICLPILSPMLFGITRFETRTYKLDPAQSKIQVQVDKAGWLKALGHDHLIEAKDVSGTARVWPTALEQSSVTLSITTDSFTVLDSNAKAEERNDIERDMKSEKVLHVTQYPQITFTSTRVSDVKSAGEGVRLTLMGDLTLHGVTHQIAVPVLLELAETALRVQGAFELKQTHYGITPISVKAALGGISVKDEMKISFDLTARPQ